MVQGVVAKIHPKQWDNKTLYSIILNGDSTWYSTGENRPDAAVGQTVEFETTQKGKYTYVKGDIKHLADGTVTAAPEVPAGRFSGARKSFVKDTAKDDYWLRKEAKDVVTQQVIQLQSCRNSAIQLVDLFLKVGALPRVDAGEKAPTKAQTSKVVKVYEEYVNHYTKYFIDQNESIGKTKPVPEVEETPPEDAEEAAAVATKDIWNT